MEGYIKLHRKLLDKPIWLNSTPQQKTILITILLSVNYTENEWEWKGEKFKVLPGQFITSLESIKVKSGKGVSIQHIRTSLKRFEKLEFLTNESTKTGRLISIINWGSYQIKENTTNKADNKDLTKTQQRPNKDLTSIEEGKKDKKKKKVPKKKSFIPPTKEETQQYFYDNGYTKESGLKAWEYYEAGNWKDSRGNQVKSWKQKMRGVWFKDENKIKDKAYIPPTQTQATKQNEDFLL